MIDGIATQNALNTHGFGLKVDGALGPMTYTAILSLCSARSLSSLPLAPELGKSLATRLPVAGIDTPCALLCFLANAAVETWGFTRMKELGSVAYFTQHYENNRQLGNTHPGDGALFCGRGLDDMTGRFNYTFLAQKTGLDCVNHPELLEQPDIAVRAGVFFWTEHNCNAICAANNPQAALPLTRRVVNGGENGLSDAVIYLNRLIPVIH